MTFEPLTEIPQEPDLQAAFNAGASLAGMEPEEGTEPVRRRGRPRGSRNAPRSGAGAKQLGDLAITAFVLIVTFTIGEWAAPSPEEANAIKVPLGNILARRIDLATKLGRDADDVIALVIAVTLWMSRVAPIAVERTRDAWRERQRRIEANRVERPPEPLDGEGTAGMGVRQDDTERTVDLARANPADVLAKARRDAFRGIDAYPVGNQG